MIEMKKAFQEYFRKLNEYAYREYGTLPTVVNSDEWDKSMLIGDEDEEGYIQWRPKEIQVNLDWKSLEQSFGFNLKEDLKAYYTSYLFIRLSGEFDEIKINFDRIVDVNTIPQLIKKQHRDGEYYLPGQQMFLLGGVSLDGCDDLLILYRNNDGKVICYDPELKRQFVFDYSLAEIIGGMEVYR